MYPAAVRRTDLFPPAGAGAVPNRKAGPQPASPWLRFCPDLRRRLSAFTARLGTADSALRSCGLGSGRSDWTIQARGPRTAWWDLQLHVEYLGMAHYRWRLALS